MGFLDYLCCCFGKRLDTEDIVDMLSDPGGFARVAAGFGVTNLSRTDRTSCNTTAIILGKMIQGSLAEKKNGAVSDIVNALQARMAAVVNLKPDHWFCVVPGEQAGEVVLLQSYQNVYVIDEWLRQRNGGSMSMQQFTDSLTAVVSQPSPDDAVRLFSCSQADADTIRNDFSVKATIDKLYTVGSFKWKV